MIQIGQGRVFSRVTLAALIAAGCSGKVERDEANGSAGAPPGGVLGNGGDSSTASVGGVANGKPVANGGSPSTSGVGGSWAGGFNAVIGGGAAGGAPVAGAPACAPSGAGGVSGAGVGGALPGVGGYGPACMSPNAGKEVLLTPIDGWVDGASNELGIQGDLYTAADSRSALNMSDDFTNSNVCLKGVAAQVDLDCTPIPPAPDCQMTTWGAAIYMNLNQPLDPNTMMGGTPATFDGSALRGFSFELSGPNVPVPNNLRFQVETDKWQFCNPWSSPLELGVNTVRLSDLFQYCFFSRNNRSEGESAASPLAASSLIRLKWQVLTISTGETPYDFCVSNLRAIYR